MLNWAYSSASLLRAGPIPIRTAPFQKKKQHETQIKTQYGNPLKRTVESQSNKQNRRSLKTLRYTQPRTYWTAKGSFIYYYFDGRSLDYSSAEEETASRDGSWRRV
jgi:hypothetical protein